MKKTISSIMLALLATCCLDVVTAQEDGNILTNEDILTLITGDVSQLVISEKIRLGDTDFDTSPEALVLLSQAGTPEHVLLAMVHADASGDRCADDSASD